MCKYRLLSLRYLIEVSARNFSLDALVLTRARLRGPVSLKDRKEPLKSALSFCGVALNARAIFALESAFALSRSPCMRCLHCTTKTEATN